MFRRRLGEVSRLLITVRSISPSGCLDNSILLKLWSAHSVHSLYGSFPLKCKVCMALQRKNFPWIQNTYYFKGKSLFTSDPPTKSFCKWGNGILRRLRDCTKVTSLTKLRLKMVNICFEEENDDETTDKCVLRKKWGQDKYFMSGFNTETKPGSTDFFFLPLNKSIVESPSQTKTSARDITTVCS